MFYAEADGFHEKTVQERAIKTLKEERGLGPLKASILRNGFIPVERLVVRKYEAAPDKFLIIEGNRRLAALRWIADDQAAGVNIPAEAKAVLNEVPVIIVEGDDSGLFQ
jgi:ParB-like chromosome segregation protein Spo0J